MSRVVLLGATGYQGGLAAAALRRRGIAPLLAGRNPERLQRVATELGGLPWKVVDARDSAALAGLLGRGDVLVTTAGPFCRLGAPQVEAAIAQHAHYLDSCGESAYFRETLARFDAPARANRSAVLTACAYDFFPGNLVADHVLALAGTDAVRVDIGYFGDTAPGYRVSAGSRASGLETMLEPGLFWRGGQHVLEPLGVRLGHMEHAGAARPGISMAGTEHLFLPALHPQLRDIHSYWGWAGGATRAVQWVSRINAALARRPGIKRAYNALLARVARSDGSGPSSELRARSASYVCAAAFDAHGRELAAAELGNIDGFSFTANILAWAADAILRDGVGAHGVVGPIQAFGRERLRDGHAEAGFHLQPRNTEVASA